MSSTSLVFKSAGNVALPVLAQPRATRPANEACVTRKVRTEKSGPKKYALAYANDIKQNPRKAQLVMHVVSKAQESPPGCVMENNRHRKDSKQDTHLPLRNIPPVSVMGKRRQHQVRTCAGTHKMHSVSFNSDLMSGNFWAEFDSCTVCSKGASRRLFRIVDSVDANQLVSISLPLFVV